MTGASFALAGMIVNEKEIARVRNDTINPLARIIVEPTLNLALINIQLKNGSNFDQKSLPFLNYLVSG
jgi:hypothetical protein